VPQRTELAFCPFPLNENQKRLLCAFCAIRTCERDGVMETVLGGCARQKPGAHYATTSRRSQSNGTITCARKVQWLPCRAWRISDHRSRRSRRPARPGVRVGAAHVIRAGDHPYRWRFAREDQVRFLAGRRPRREIDVDAAVVIRSILLRHPGSPLRGRAVWLDRVRFAALQSNFDRRAGAPAFSTVADCAAHRIVHSELSRC
jgi:hypothetical protein